MEERKDEQKVCAKISLSVKLKARNSLYEQLYE